MLTFQKYNFILLFCLVSISFAIIVSVAAYDSDPLEATRFYYDAAKTKNVFGSDFNANYFAAKRYFSGDSLFFTDKQEKKYGEELTAGERSRFIYYPFSALFFAPLAFLSFEHAFFALTILNVICLLVILLLLSKFAASRQLYFLVFSFLFAFSPVFWSILERGQTDIIILLFLTLCFVCFLKKKSKLSGFFLALAALFKLTPLFLLPFFYFKDRKAFFSSLLSFIVISLIIGPAKLVDFFRSLFLFSLERSSSYLNTGIFGLLDNRITAPLLNANLAHLIYLIVVVPLVLLFFYGFSKRVGENGDETTNLAEYGFFLAIMFLLPTVSWIQHSIHFLFVATAYWAVRERAVFRREIVFMDILLLLIFSGPLLLTQFQKIPLSVIFAFRPVYVLLFLAIFYFTFLRGQNGKIFNKNNPTEIATRLPGAEL